MSEFLNLIVPSSIAGLLVLVGVFVTRADARRDKRKESDGKVREVEAGAYQRASAIDAGAMGRMAAEIARLEARENERDIEIELLRTRVTLLERKLRENEIELP